MVPHVTKKNTAVDFQLFDIKAFKKEYWIQCTVCAKIMAPPLESTVHARKDKKV